MKKNSLIFPQSFRFSVATAAHQIEGNNISSDWWKWEHQSGTIKENHRSGKATDSRAHVAEDIQYMKWLGTDVYRLSVEWAKIEPKAGQYEDSVLLDYAAQMDELLAAGIEPMVTLYHFTLPQWVAEKGGWEWNGITPAFQKFTERVAIALGRKVRLWITLNEPMSIIVAGYISNVFPPAKNDLRSIALPMENMIRAHAACYHTLHRILDTPDFKVSVGLAHHLRNFDAYRWFNPLDHLTARKFDAIFNWSIPLALQTGVFKFNLPFTAKANASIPEAKGTQDFFGINYYSRDLIALKLFSKERLQRLLTPGAAVTDLAWEIYPLGLKRLLQQIHHRFPKMPIWVTENGLADRSDTKRFDYIRDHLQVLAEAIRDGIDIQGYSHWTLNDNFEWAEGWTAQFGLFALEPETLKRIPRESAKRYAALIQEIRKSP